MKQVSIFLIFFAMLTQADAQVLQSVTTNSGSIGQQGLSLNINGSDLNFNHDTNTIVIFSNTITGHEIYGYNFSSVNSTNASVNIDIDYASDTGFYNLFIKDSLNQLTLNNAFTVLPKLPATPTLNISPASAALHSTVQVAVTGHLTHFLSNANFYIQFPGYVATVNAPIQQITNDSSATVSLNLNGLVTSGIYNFYVQDTTDNKVLSTGNFIVTGRLPQITTPIPDSGQTHTEPEVFVIGNNTLFTDAATTATWLDRSGFVIFPVYLNSFILSSSIPAQFVIPANVPNGWYDIHTFDDIDGELVKPHGFFISNAVSAIPDMSFGMTSLQMFPNPSTDHVNFVVNTAQEQYVSVTVYDIAGKAVMQKHMLIPSGRSTSDIDVSQFANGIYTINLNSGQQQLHLQFVVAHS